MWGGAGSPLRLRRISPSLWRLCRARPRISHGPCLRTTERLWWWSSSAPEAETADVPPPQPLRKRRPASGLNSRRVRSCAISARTLARAMRAAVRSPEVLAARSRLISAWRRDAAVFETPVLPLPQAATSMAMSTTRAMDRITGPLDPTRRWLVQEERVVMYPYLMAPARDDWWLAFSIACSIRCRAFRAAVPPPRCR